MFDGKFRTGVDRAVKPISAGLRRTGMSPDHLTVMGLLVAVGKGRGRDRRRRTPPRPRARHPGRAARPVRRRPREGHRRLEPARCVLELGDRPGHRQRAAVRRCGVVLRLSEESPHMSLLPFAVLGVSSVISYAGGRRPSRSGTWHESEGRADGARRADHPVLPQSAHPAAADPDPVGDARPHRGHRGAALDPRCGRQADVAPSHGRDRDAPQPWTEPARWCAPSAAALASRVSAAGRHGRPTVSPADPRPSPIR